MPRALRLLVTCEHGGNRIPPRYAPLFRGQRRALDSHAGHDPGALAVARTMVGALEHDWPIRFFHATTSRLLVDLNRSLGHRRLHGEPVRALDPAERRAIVERHYLPYRSAVERAVEADVQAGARVLHLSCHSFTPRRDGRERRADIGLLYDPARRAEVRIARAWRAALLGDDPALRVRFNYPYRGSADGFTTALRRRFRDAQYAGIELEVNQAFALGDARAWRALRQRLAASLRRVLAAAPRDATNGPDGGAERPRIDRRPGRLAVT